MDPAKINPVFAAFDTQGAFFQNVLQHKQEIWKDRLRCLIRFHRVVGGGGGRGGLFQCPIQVTPGTVGHLLLDVTCPYDQDEPGGHVIRLKHLTSVLDRH